MVKTLDTDFEMNTEQVVASPKDEILDAVIIKIEKGLLSEFINPEVHHKFDNLESETLLVHFETKYNDRIIGGTDRIRFYEEPMINSNLGKFITKYNTLKVGIKIKVEFNADGFSSIKIK